MLDTLRPGWLTPAKPPHLSKQLSEAASKYLGQKEGNDLEVKACSSQDQSSPKPSSVGSQPLASANTWRLDRAPSAVPLHVWQTPVPFRNILLTSISAAELRSKPGCKLPRRTQEELTLLSGSSFPPRPCCLFAAPSTEQHWPPVAAAPQPRPGAASSRRCPPPPASWYFDYLSERGWKTPSVHIPRLGLSSMGLSPQRGWRKACLFSAPGISPKRKPTRGG